MAYWLLVIEPTRLALPETNGKPSAGSESSKLPLTTRKPSACSGPADPLRAVGACGSGVPGARLALSVPQASTAPQPCPSPGRAMKRAPGRAVAGGSVTRHGLGGAERHLLRERRSHERRAGPRVGRGSRSRAPPWRERCSGVPGGLKGRGGVGEARTRKHRNEVRSAA